MEKDSFEKLLRSKVLQAELALNQNADKERAWNAIQKKQPPRRKLYYAAAAVLLIIGMASVFYVKNDKAIIVAPKTKVDKFAVASLPKPSAVEPAKVKQALAPTKKAEIEQLEVINPVENAAPKTSIVVQKEGPSIAVLPAANEVVAVLPIATLPEVPEFTVQFKRGKPADEVEKQTKEAIARLKRFKLSKDTSVIANTNEKQRGFFKIKF